MPSKRSAAPEAAPISDPAASQGLPEWVAAASAQGIQPEQALAFIGLGLMQKMAASSQDLPWVWNELEDGGSADLLALRQRLELVNLALQTGAPLSTAEVTALLGARPGAPVVERGGLKARRVSRNVWKLSKVESSASGFNDGFRRRL